MVVGEDGRYYLTFFHNMFIIFIYYLLSTVYDGVDLVFGIFANSLTSKTTHVVLVYQIGCFFNVYIFFVVVEGGEKGFEVAN